MAVSKILCIGNCGAGYAGKHLSQALDYISKKEKTGDGRWDGCLNCLLGNIYQQMRQTKEHFGKTDKRQGYHIILSFAEGEVDADTAFEISKTGDLPGRIWSGGTLMLLWVKLPVMKHSSLYLQAWDMGLKTLIRMK